jgi:DNA polymerase-3 subunit gamma/tau
MSHLTLYRKYRPQTFSDVVGQDHVTKTLSNAVVEDRIAHAYLFSGTLGTG